jgi:hypothetical protein
MGCTNVETVDPYCSALLAASPVVQTQSVLSLIAVLELMLSLWQVSYAQLFAALCF